MDMGGNCCRWLHCFQHDRIAIVGSDLNLPDVNRESAKVGPSWRRIIIDGGILGCAGHTVPVGLLPQSSARATVSPAHALVLAALCASCIVPVGPLHLRAL